MTTPHVQKPQIQAWLTFISSIAWPLTVILAVLLFRSEIGELTGRVESGEFAGAKFEFSEAATGFISASMEDLVKEQNPVKREKLAKNIRGVADVLGALHPVSISYLIEHSRECLTSLYREQDEIYLNEIERLGLAKIHRTQFDQDDRVGVKLDITTKGKEFLIDIGMSKDDVSGTCSR